MTQEKPIEYDAIVVGSGPGGSTVARELARAGQKILVLELGEDNQRMGSYLTALRVMASHRSKEGMPMLVAHTTGGASVFYSASAADPPPWLASEYNIDLTPWLDEIKQETSTRLLPEDLLGKGSVRVMETANKLGYHWEPMPKFLNPEKFVNGRCCGANTHLGCKCGAKWTAREYLRDAVEAGAELLTETKCEEVIVENGNVVGVRARTKGGPLEEYRASRVILAAGGLGSPLLLKKAGIDQAGNGCVMDPTQIIYGQAPFDGTWPDPPACVVSWEFHESDGIRLGTIVEPRLLLAMNLLKKSPRYFRIPLNYGKLVGLFVKVKDDLSGQVSPDGSVTKPFSEEDYNRLEKGMEVATEILRALGCPPDRIVKGDIKGAHPSGTCRIGHVVNNDLETEIKNLYVCDASVFPQALDRPTVMTIIGLGKRLCQQILAPERVTAKALASTPEAS